MRILFGHCMFLLLSLGICAQADEPVASQEEIEARLKALEEEISEYKELLENTRGEKSEIEETLKRNEQGINDLLNQIQEIESELEESEDRVSALSDERGELLKAKSEQQHYIERQIRAAYEIGNQEYLKVLLSQEDPDEIARMLTYYDYFNEARADQVRAYNSTIARLNQVTRELAAEMETLADTMVNLVDQQRALAATQVEKEATLKLLISQIRDTGTELTRLEADREQLEQLLDRLQQQLANIPAPSLAEPFSGMLGKLQLPVEGTVRSKFGTGRNQGKLKWQGVFIEAREGDPVHAVHYGRVVFSDWLRGFGLLMIISHGEGYMSLYGHNQALYRETGEWVTAGDVIATVGNSGGQNQTGLYFEIRIDGKPADPQQWCMTRNQSAA